MKIWKLILGALLVPVFATLLLRSPSLGSSQPTVAAPIGKGGLVESLVDFSNQTPDHRLTVDCKHGYGNLSFVARDSGGVVMVMLKGDTATYVELDRKGKCALCPDGYGWFNTQLEPVHHVNNEHYLFYRPPAALGRRLW